MRMSRQGRGPLDVTRQRIDGGSTCRPGVQDAQEQLAVGSAEPALGVTDHTVAHGAWWVRVQLLAATATASHAGLLRPVGGVEHRHQELAGQVGQLLVVIEVDDVAGDDQERAADADHQFGDDIHVHVAGDLAGLLLPA